MAIDTTVPRTRRALLAGGVGGLAALAASALGRPLPLRAYDGEPMVVGGEYTATSVTAITTTELNGVAIQGTSYSSTGVFGVSGDGAGVLGSSALGYGVMGESVSGTGVVGSSSSGYGAHGGSGTGCGVRAEASSGRGVYATSNSGIGVVGSTYAASLPAILGTSLGNGTGLLGFSGTAYVPSTVARTGVYGYAAQDATARGVTGQTTAGRGVNGQATSGVGTYGYAASGTGGSFATSTGYALRTSGRVRVDKASGVTTILAGNTVALVKPGLEITSSSFVLLTPRGNLGGRDLWYTVNATTNEITIRVSSAVTADLQVGWLLLG